MSERVVELFPWMMERRDQHAGTLSGRRAADARDRPRVDARPRLLLLDEPSLGLAPFVVEEIFRIVRELNKRGA